MGGRLARAEIGPVPLKDALEMKFMLATSHLESK